jgi:methyl-accepting chemotaxis protein
MDNNNGIGRKLYMLIGFVMVFIIGISSFSWLTFKRFDENYKSRLQRTSEYINLVDEARISQVEFKTQVQNWKDTLIRGLDPSSFKIYYSQFSQENDNVQSELNKLKIDMTKQGLATTSVDALIKTHKELFEKYSNAIQSYDINNPQSYLIVDKLVKGIDRKPSDDLNSLVKQIQNNSADEINTMKHQSDIDTNNFERSLILIVMIGVFLTLLFTAMIISTYKGITKFIEQFAVLLEKAEGGDLTVKGEIVKRDELSQLIVKFNGFMERIRSLIFEAKETSEAVASFSNEIMKTSDEVSISAEEVASATSDISESAAKQTELAEHGNTSLYGVVDGLQRIAGNTLTINDLADKSINSVSHGLASLKSQHENMSSTKKASQTVTNVISDLSTKSKEIGDVVKFINTITSQINLLALNASIEAARAGEAGRGFSVVANEVKKLAQLSEESTQKISALIGEVQTDIEEAVVEVNNTKVSIEEQAASLQQTDDSFNLIQQSISEVAAKIKDVTSETKEINNNAINVQEIIQDITDIIERNALRSKEVASATEEQTASSQQVAASINQLAELSNTLEKSIAKFKV